MNKKAEVFQLQGENLLRSFISHEADEGQSEGAVWIPTGNIVPGRFQQRRYFSEESLENLTTRFKEQGFRGVLNIRQVATNRYEIVAGERRWRAAIAAGLTEVLCLVDEYSDEDALEFGLVENLLREDLSKLEETEGILNLLQLKLSCPREKILTIIQTEGHTDKTNAEKKSEELSKILEILGAFGIELQTFRTKHLRTLKLPPILVKAHLEQNLSYLIALEIAKLPDLEKMKALLEETLKKKLSFREVNERVKEANGKPSTDQKLQKRLQLIAKQGGVLKGKKKQQFEQLLKEIEALLE